MQSQTENQYSMIFGSQKQSITFGSLENPGVEVDFQIHSTTLRTPQSKALTRIQLNKNTGALHKNVKSIEPSSTITAFRKVDQDHFKEFYNQLPKSVSSKNLGNITSTSSFFRQSQKNQKFHNNHTDIKNQLSLYDQENKYPSNEFRVTTTSKVAQTGFNFFHAKSSEQDFPQNSQIFSSFDNLGSPHRVENPDVIYLNTMYQDVVKTLQPTVKERRIKELIQTPQHFYELGKLGYQNYLYPCPPESSLSERKNSRQIIIQKDPCVIDQNIETICLKQIKSEDSFDQINLIRQQFYNNSQTNKPNSISNINPNNFNLEGDQQVNFPVLDNISVSQNLLAFDENTKQTPTQDARETQTQQEKQKQRSQGNDETSTKYFTSLQRIQKGIYETNLASYQFHYSGSSGQADHQIQIDPLNQQNVEMPVNTQRASKQNEATQEAIQYNKISQSLQLQIIIENFNQLVALSKTTRPTLPTEENEMVAFHQKYTSCGKRSDQNNCPQLYAFIEYFDILQFNKPIVRDRILLSMGLNPRDLFSYISMEKFIYFYRILIHRDSALSQTCNFIEKFLRLDEDSPMSVDQFLRILRALTLASSNDARVDEQLYEFLIENFKITGVIPENAQFVEFDKLQAALTSNAVNIYDLIDLICGLN